jgi:hypothetical protein
MIFFFLSKVNDGWQEKFYSGVSDMKSVPCAWDENGKPTLYNYVEGPNHTHKCDYDGIAEIQKRITNGFRLFGKYFEALWD